MLSQSLSAIAQEVSGRISGVAGGGHSRVKSDPSQEAHIIFTPFTERNSTAHHRHSLPSYTQ